MKKRRKSKKGYVGLLILIIITIISAFLKVNNSSKRKSIDGNLFIHSSSKDFNGNNAELEDVKVSSEIEDGAIILKSNVVKGIYTSDIINTSPFEYLVLSWNSDTPEGTSIEIEGRVAVKRLNDDTQLVEEWSHWLSWGIWGTSIKRASGTGNVDDSVAYVDTDTLVIKGSNGETASKIQYRVTLNTNRAGVTPAVKLISGAIRNTISGQEINKVFNENVDLTNLKVLDVPRFSQMLRDPLIANSICSATSISMILNYYGTEVLPEEVAWGVYDYKYDGFGNWPFNTAYASSFGYSAYVDYSTIEGLKREIYNGHPVAVSVKYKNNINVESSFPVLDGAPIKSTDGHLIVVCGFTNENGCDYIVINDPAASTNEGVRVKYRLDQFEDAWAEFGNVAYIIH